MTETPPIKIAASVVARFPDPEQSQVYDTIRALGEDPRLALHLFHSQAGDPASWPAAFTEESPLVPWRVPAVAELQQEDQLHFQRTAPERFDALVDELAAELGWERDRVLGVWELSTGMSYARHVQGLGIDYIHTWYTYDQSLAALIAARLLGIPRGITICQGFEQPDWELKFPRLHLKTADLIVTPDQETRDKALEIGGAEVESKLCWEKDLDVAAIVQVCANAGDRALGRGVASAYFESSARPMRRDERVRPLVVLGAERTGTNLLLEQLGFDWGYELFNPDNVRDEFVPVREEPLRKDPELIALRAKDPCAFLERLQQIAAESGERVAPFKFLYYHAATNQMVLDFLVQNRDYAVVHVLRGNRLARFLSNKRSEQSGSWYRGSHRPDKGKVQTSLELDIGEMIADFEYHQQEERKYRELFAGHDYLEIRYEEFSGAGGRDAVAQRFGLELPPPINRAMKTSSKHLRDSIANWDAVVSALQGTPWSGLVEASTGR